MPKRSKDSHQAKQHNNANKFKASSFFSRIYAFIKSKFQFYRTINALKSGAKKLSSEEKHVLGNFLKYILRTIEKKMSTEEKNIFTNFLQFGEKTVKDVMVPRSDISAMNIRLSLEEASSYVTKDGHTRTILYQNTLDEVVGFVHLRDLFSAVSKEPGATLKKLSRKPLFTTSSSKLVDLLVEMRRTRTHIAIVIDEYGGTEGIVTIEDIVEEIVGDIEDEHSDKNHSHDYTLVSDNTIITSGRVEIEELEKALGISLRNGEEDVDTIGGLVITRAQHMPEVGDIIPIADSLTAEVLEANSRILKRLKISYIKS